MANQTQKPHSLARRWLEFQGSPQGADAPKTPYPAEQFGDSPGEADLLSKLIFDGYKTATCSAIWEYEHEKEPLPKVGDRLIVLDSSDTAICIIESTEITICAYNAVDERFAFNEGEGDRTLNSWRELHWRFFSRLLPKIGRAPTPEMPLLCECFKVIYRW